MKKMNNIFFYFKIKINLFYYKSLIKNDNLNTKHLN